MTFVDKRLSQKVESGFTGGPEWSTLVVQMASGREMRRGNWSIPHHKYTADYTVLNPREKNEILEAFMALRGQLHSMRFKDWNDFKIINGQLGVGAGTSAPMQLVKVYQFGESSYTRKITLPVVSTLMVTSNGAPKAVTVDPATGMITPSGTWASGAVIRVSCDFDVKVRFASDSFLFSQIAQSAGQSTVELKEVIE